MATETETERLNVEFLWQRNGNGKGFRKVINKQIELLSERYEHGEDLWTGKPLCIESEIEIEFRPAMELLELDNEPIEESSTEEQDEETIEDWDNVQSPLDF